MTCCNDPRTELYNKAVEQLIKQYLDGTASEETRRSIEQGVIDTIARNMSYSSLSKEVRGSINELELRVHGTPEFQEAISEEIRKRAEYLVSTRAASIMDEEMARCVREMFTGQIKSLIAEERVNEEKRAAKKAAKASAKSSTK